MRFDPTKLPTRYQAQVAAQIYPALPQKQPKKALKAPKGHPDTLFDPSLPPCQKEWRFHPTRKWMMDFAWVAEKVALEVEGGVWTGGRHTRGEGFLGDLEKYNQATLLGWRILRCVPSAQNAPDTIGMIRKLLSQ